MSILEIILWILGGFAAMLALGKVMYEKNVEIIIFVRVVGNLCPIPQKTFVKTMEYQRDESTQILFRDYSYIAVL